MDQLSYVASDSVDSSTATVSIDIQQAATSTALTASADSIYESDSVTFTAAVSASASQAGTPGGLVTFLDGSTVLAVVALDANGEASFSTTALAIGQHSITAQFSVNGIFAGSTSQSQTVTVSQAPVWIEASQDDILVGDTVTFNAYPYDFDMSTVASVEWDFNYDGMMFNPDPAASDQLSVSRTFSAPATATIAARILTTTGYEQFGTLDIRAHYPPPVLTVPADMTITAGDTASLTLQATTDASASIASVEWWFSYDGEEWVQDTSLTSLTANVPFPDFGEVDVWVKVTDTNGESAEDGFHITVDEWAPTASSFVVTTAGPITEGSYAQFYIARAPNANVPAAWDQLWIWLYTGESGDVENDWELIEQWEEFSDGSIGFTVFYDDNPNGATSFPAQVWIGNQGGVGATFDVPVTVTNVAPSGTLVAGTGDPISGHAGTSAATVYYILPGEVVWFDDVADRSAADAAKLTYHWRLNDGAEVSTEIAELKLSAADYTDGKVTKVEAWITDKDGLASEPQTIYVAVRQGIEGLHLFGDMLPDFNPQNFPAPADIGNYDKYSAEVWKFLLPVDEQSGMSASFTVTFALDEASHYWGPPNAQLLYYYHVELWDVEQHWYGDDHILLWQQDSVDPASGFALPSVGKDREWVIRAVPILDDIGDPNIDWTQVAVPEMSHTIIVDTPKTLTTWQWLRDKYELIRQIAQSFGDRADALLNAITNDQEGGFLDRVAWGFAQAVDQYFSNLGTNLGNAVYNWLKTQANGIDFSAFTGLTNLTSGDNLKAFLLQYSGLTWEHLSEVVLSTLGQGNVAAVETIAGWFDNISTSDPLSMFRFLQDLPNKAATLGLSIDLSEVWNNLESRATSVLTSSLSTMTTRLATLFVPGAGTIRAIYNGLSWLSNNMQQLSGLFNGFVDALLGTDANDVKTKLLATFNSATETLVSFAAAQLGLSKLPGELRKVLSYVPQKVDSGMRKLLADAAGKVRLNSGSSDEMFKGIVSEKKEFDYGGKNYVLWAVQSGTTVKVKLAEKVNGQWKLIAELKDANFTTTAAKGDYTALFGKAKSLADATKPNAQNKNPAAIAALASLSTQVKSAENTLAGDANACSVLNAGCFAAGTKLWTPDGYRNVEEIEEGEFVYSRDEWDPNGAIEAKTVEKKFERMGRILHLHLIGGELIRTTPEHPFFVSPSPTRKQGGEWVAAGALMSGDEIRTDSGWATVEDVFDTGCYETVYNLRVAEHHTYFVGADDWGFSVWAHNTSCDWSGVLASVSAASAQMRQTMANLYTGGDISRVHAHHIVPKTVPNDARAPYITAAKDILLSVGIDPYQVDSGTTEMQSLARARADVKNHVKLYNLTWAVNQDHSIEYARSVAEKLQDAIQDKTGFAKKQAVIDALAEIANELNHGRLFRYP